MAEPESRLTTPQALSLLADVPAGATVILLGATDTGKTTFALETATAFVRAGQTVALLDCDLGQSEVGPPGTLGLALTQNNRPGPIRTGRDLEFLATAFVGATTPAAHLLQTTAGACHLARVARERNPDLLLVDTPGWTHGPGARHFLRHLADLLQPHTLLAFSRGEELMPLLAPFRRQQSPRIWHVAPDAAVTRKSPSARAARRAARFAAAFLGASEITLSADQIALCETDLFSGPPLPHHVQQFLAQTLSVPVLHAERRPGGAPYVIVHGERWNSQGLAAAAEYFKTSSLTIVPAQRFARLLVGLVSDRGEMLDIGLLTRIDFTRRVLTILTRSKRPAAVAQVWCGVIRVRPDGREIGTLRPGEL